MNAMSPLTRSRSEAPEIKQLREALGAVAIGPALAYSVSRSKGSRWQVRRLDQKNGADFDNRTAALAAMRRAVVRSSAYCLVVEGCSGDFEVQLLNWDAEAEHKFGIRP